MKVARHFSAGVRIQTSERPVRDERNNALSTLRYRSISGRTKVIYRPIRDGLLLKTLTTLKCGATFTDSLRDRSIAGQQTRFPIPTN
jgi:hypothetical protein